LLQKPPEDTEKRYTSRCYHRVKDFEIEAGKGEADAKNLAPTMHKHAKEMWNSMFVADSLSTYFFTFLHLYRSWQPLFEAF
jgi:hypothetical protein